MLIEVTAGVVIGNVLSIAGSTLLNNYLDKKSRAKRQEELDKLFEALDMEREEMVKKAAKKPVRKVKKD